MVYMWLNKWLQSCQIVRCSMVRRGAKKIKFLKKMTPKFTVICGADTAQLIQFNSAVWCSRKLSL